MPGKPKLAYFKVAAKEGTSATVTVQPPLGAANAEVVKVGEEHGLNGVRNSVRFELTVPEGTAPGFYDVTVSYTDPGGHTRTGKAKLCVLRIDVVGSFAGEREKGGGTHTGIAGKVADKHRCVTRLLDDTHPTYMLVLCDDGDLDAIDRVQVEGTGEQCTSLDLAFFNSLALQWNVQTPTGNPYTGFGIAGTVASAYGIAYNDLLGGDYWATPARTDETSMTLYVMPDAVRIAATLPLELKEERVYCFVWGGDDLNMHVPGHDFILPIAQYLEGLGDPRYTCYADVPNWESTGDPIGFDQSGIDAAFADDALLEHPHVVVLDFNLTLSDWNAYMGRKTVRGVFWVFSHGGYSELNLSRVYLGLPGNPFSGLNGPVLFVSDWVSSLDVQYQLPVDFAAVNACWSGGGDGLDIVSFEYLRYDHATHTQTIYNTCSANPAVATGDGRARIDGEHQGEQEGMDASIITTWIRDQ